MNENSICISLARQAAFPSPRVRQADKQKKIDAQNKKDLDLLKADPKKLFELVIEQKYRDLKKEDDPQYDPKNNPPPTYWDVAFVL